MKKRSIKKRSINNIKVTKLIGITFGLIIIIMTLNSFLGFRGSKNIYNEAKYSYESVRKESEAVNDISFSVLNCRINILKMVYEGFSTSRDNAVTEEYNNTKTYLKEYIENEGVSENSKKSASEALRGLEVYWKLWNETRDTLKEGEGVSAQKVQELATQGERVIGEIKEAIKGNKEAGDAKWAAVTNGYKENEVFRTIISIIGGIIIISLAFILIRKIKMILREFNYILSEVSNGNLSVEIKHWGKNEFSEMKILLKKAISSISNTVSHIKSGTEIISQNSRTLEAISNQISSATGDVATSIQEVAEGATNQSKELSDINSQMTMFSENLNEIIVTLGVVTSSAEGVSHVAKLSNRDLENLKTSIGDIKNSFEDVTSKIDSLSKSLRKIGDITEVIDNIAEETNMLALNAAIEAARAGDAGRGFTVVAEEVRSLAEQSKKSVREVNDLIKEIVEESSSVKKCANSASEDLHSEIKNVNNSISTFKNVILSVEKIPNEIENVSKLINELNKEKDEILNKVETSSSMAENFSANSEQIAASGEEVSASSQEVLLAAQALLRKTEDMLKYISNFKLSEENKKYH